MLARLRLYGTKNFSSGISVWHARIWLLGLFSCHDVGLHFVVNLSSLVIDLTQVFSKTMYRCRVISAVFFTFLFCWDYLLMAMKQTVKLGWNYFKNSIVLFLTTGDWCWKSISLHAYERILLFPLSLESVISVKISRQIWKESTSWWYLTMFC